MTVIVMHLVIFMRWKQTFGHIRKTMGFCCIYVGIQVVSREIHFAFQ